VTRPIAIAYAQHLKQQCADNIFTQHYCSDIYHILRYFFAFLIDDGVDEQLQRNPFAPKDMPGKPDMLPRYLSDQEIRAILLYCEQEATLLEKTIVTLLLHTGIRAAELASLKASDVVQIGGVWKLHIHQGKGLKDRIIPLTQRCREILQIWMSEGWEHVNDFLFTNHVRPWANASGCSAVSTLVRELGLKIHVIGLTAHQFRHTFAVALLNYGIRESALQKLMGHATLGMTLEYARILDQTVERSFSDVVEQMVEGTYSWVPNFFVQEEYTLFAEGDAISWIRLPLGYCRRNPKLHCESDVKCLRCERFAIGREDLPRLNQMRERFLKLGLSIKAEVVAAQIQQLEKNEETHQISFIPSHSIARMHR
jgi:integrase